MPLENFPLLQDNTRLIRFLDTLYKVKVKYDAASFRKKETTINELSAHHDIEQTFRAVLYLSERNQELKSICTSNFLIKPLKVPWSFPKKNKNYVFKQNGKTLKVHEYMFEFHISKRNEPDNVTQSAAPRIKTMNAINSDSKQVKDLLHKEPVVLIKDCALSSNIPRFGRTKDGQLYRMDPMRGKISETHTSALNKSAWDNDAHTENQLLKSTVLQEKESKEMKTAVQAQGTANSGREMKNRISKSITPEKHSNAEHKNGSGKPNASYTDRRDSKLGSLVSMSGKRNKFSLRTAELQALSVDTLPHRLRDRHGMLVSSDKSRSAGLHYQRNESRYRERSTDSESDGSQQQDKDADEKVNENKINHEVGRLLRTSELVLVSDSESSQQNERVENTLVSTGQQPKSKQDFNQHRNGRLPVRRRERERMEIQEDTSSQSDGDFVKPDKGKMLKYNTKRNKGSVNIQEKQMETTDKSKHKSQKDIQVISSKEKEHISKSKQRSRNSTILARLTDTESYLNSKDKNRGNEDTRETRSGMSHSGNERTMETRSGKPLRGNHSAPETRKRSNEGKGNKSSPETRKKLNIGNKSTRKTRSSIQSSVVSQSSRSSTDQSDSEGNSAVSPRKKRKLDRSNIIQLPEDTLTGSQTSQGSSQGSRKIRLYARRNSPQIVGNAAVKETIEIVSPRVSTVMPLKRTVDGAAVSNRNNNNNGRDAISPRTRRQALQDEESERIQSMRESERPTRVYRDIMLAQGRDRHMVEQAERAETDKLRHLYEPTVPRTSPRLTGNRQMKERRSSGLWGKIMDNLVTPTKQYMFGPRKNKL